MSGLLYVTGVIVENINLGLLGIHNFAEIRPRMVLVGATFYCYLLIPAALLCLPELCIDWTVKNGLAERSRLNSIATYLLWLFIIPTPFQYFIDDVSWKATLFLRVVTFWDYFFHLPTLNWIFAFLVSLAVSRQSWPQFRIRRWVHSTDSRKAVFHIAFILTAIGSLVPFVFFMFRNISYSVGGGMPQCVEVTLREKVEPKLESATLYDVEQSLAFAIDDPDSALLLWHETDDMIYVTQGKTDLPLYPVYGIPKSRIASIRFHPAYLHIDGDKLTRFTRVPDFYFLMNFLDIAKKRATTAPTTTPSVSTTLPEAREKSSSQPS